MSSSSNKTNVLKYKGCSQFRQRIIASTLSNKILRIDDIRSGQIDELNPGLLDFEASFLRLIDKITDGCRIEINETGTSLKYKPGMIIGGILSHDCTVATASDTDSDSSRKSHRLCRSIGWYIEGIIPIVIFGKKPLTLSLTGITNDALDLSVDTLINVTLPLLRNFGIEGASLKIKRRGAAPKGGGIVELYIPVAREILPIDLTNTGLIKRVRGIAFCSRISPTILSRVVDSARDVLNNLLPDVHIHTDHYKGIDGGFSPGYSLAMVAESTTGVLLSAERTATSRVDGMGELPEDVGREGSLLLLEEIKRGGVVDSAHQCLVIQLMLLGPEDVSRIKLGALTQQSIKLLRLIKDAFGVTFKVKEDTTDGSVTLSCLGIGYKNYSRKAT